MLPLKVQVLVTQLRPTFCNPMACGPSGSSVCGILQARILQWVAISFCRGSSRPRDQTRVSCIAGRFFTVWATREDPLMVAPGSYHYNPHLKIRGAGLTNVTVLVSGWARLLNSILPDSWVRDLKYHPLVPPREGSMLIFFRIRYSIRGLPWWLSGRESACQCKRCGLDPWAGKIPWRRK